MKLILAIAVCMFGALATFAQPCFEKAKQVKPAMDDETVRTYAANLAVARETYSKNPNVAEELIWYGRRVAYTGEYKDASGSFRRASVSFPTMPECIVTVGIGTSHSDVSTMRSAISKRRQN